MKGIQTLKRGLAMIAMCLCLTFAAVPAMETYAASQTETQVAEEQPLQRLREAMKKHFS